VCGGSHLSLLSFHFIKDYVVPTHHLVCKELHQMTNSKYSRTVCDDDIPAPDTMLQKGARNKDINASSEIIESNSNIVACNGINHFISTIMLSQK